MEIAIVALEGRRGGDEAALKIRIRDGERVEERELVVASRMLFEIGNIGGGVLPYALSCEQFDTLDYDAKLWEAVKKAYDLLAYGDNSKKRLSEKLRQRGFDREIAEEAVEYAERLGVVDEKRQLEHVVGQLVSKCYGRSRIKQELIRKGISREIIDEYLDDLLEEVDFDALLEKLLRKKVDFEMIGSGPEGRKYREKVISAMFRYGYSPDEVRRKLREICE